MTEKDLEEIEHSYLKSLFYCFKQDGNVLLKLLNSKEKIRSDWENHLKRQNSDKSTSSLDTGAERVVSFLVSKLYDFEPNSTPIGSDIVFETKKAIIHLDIKTYRWSNRSDFKHFSISDNQTSYKTNYKIKKEKPRQSSPKLPEEYTIKNTTKKYCLTYFIGVLHKEKNNSKESIVSIIIACCPNNKLRKYEDIVFKAGKNVGKLRFDWMKCEDFKELKGKKRVLVVYLQDLNKLEEYKDNKLIKKLSELEKAQPKL